MRTAMKTLYLVESVVMGVCISYTSICWVVDLGSVGNMDSGVRYHLLFPAGLVSTGAGFASALSAHRRRPTLARITMIACMFWAIWAYLPRL